MQQGTCERCGTGFNRTHPLKRFCSERCQRQAEKQRYRGRRTDLATCKGCGLPFYRNDRRQVYCSVSCQYESRSVEYRQRDDIGRPEDSTLSDYLTALRNDPCAYCGEEGGQIDHIEPRSLDGPNHWENYTGTCPRCNSLKRDKSLICFLGWKQAAVAFDGWRVLAGNDSPRGDHRSKEAAGVG